MVWVSSWQKCKLNCPIVGLWSLNIRFDFSSMRRVSTQILFLLQIGCNETASQHIVQIFFKISVGKHFDDS